MAITVWFMIRLNNSYSHWVSIVNGGYKPIYNVWRPHIVAPPQKSRERKRLETWKI